MNRITNFSQRKMPYTKNTHTIQDWERWQHQSDIWDSECCVSIFIFTTIRITISKSRIKWWSLCVYYFLLCKWTERTIKHRLSMRLLYSIWKLKETQKSVHARNRALTAFILMRQQHSNGQIKLCTFFFHFNIHFTALRWDLLHHKHFFWRNNLSKSRAEC